MSGDFYKMEVHTSDKFGAGTDASVRMCFTDAQGQVGGEKGGVEGGAEERGL